MLRRCSIWILTLVALLVLYTGLYLAVDHTGRGRMLIRSQRGTVPFSESSAYPFVDAVFAPARWVERHLVLNPRHRRYLAGTWYLHMPWHGRAEPFHLVLSPDGQCSFTLGQYTHGGLATFNPVTRGFTLRFDHDGLRHTLELFTKHAYLDRSPKSVSVTITPNGSPLPPDGWDLSSLPPDASFEVAPLTLPPMHPQVRDPDDRTSLDVPSLLDGP